MDSRLTALVVSPIFPLPANTGSLVRIFNITKGLNKNFDITFTSPASGSISNNDLEISNVFSNNSVFGNIYSTGAFAELKALFSLSPYHVNLYYSTDLQQKIANLIKKNKYSFIYCNFIYTLAYFSNLKMDVPIFVDQQNVDAGYWLRKVKNSKNILEKFMSYMNLKKTVYFEKKWLSVLSL